MIIGCFALVEPFRPLADQLQLIRDMGIEYADLTDNHNGGMLGVEYGFTASISLDTHPAAVRKMAEAAGITLTSVCAHANLLDPTSPDRYGTAEIIKAIRLANLLGIDQVITTEGDPKTDFGHALTPDQRLFTIAEKLQAPLEWAVELGVELLLEPHGIVTDSVDGMRSLFDTLGHEDTLGVCLDTGNSWLGGAAPLDFVRAFGPRIRHVHWKDMPAEMEAQRGSIYGTGMSIIPLGDGVVGVRAIVDALLDAGFDGPTTLEVAGADNVKASAERLQEWSAR
ncbi:sugar phosphate isomerase/epimerase [bacterium]|nr:sugar phosphate isomerase/epimerase [bacterium]